MTSQSSRSELVSYLFCYLIWVGLCCLLGVAVLQANGVMLDISLALRLNQWGGRALRQLSLPILGIAWLVAIFWLEHYLRVGVQRHVLWKRAGRSAAIVGVLFGIIALAHWLI